MNNSLTDVPGIRVGSAEDLRLLSGATAVLFDTPAVASVSVLGGAPAGRDLGCLEPDATVERIDAIVLSGGSAFGLDAPGGVQAWLREQGRGFAVGPARVPIVPAAICFDLNNGGDKTWGRHSPYPELGYRAAAAAGGEAVALGSVGAGCGLATANLKGGLGAASALTSAGHTVAALAAVNAIGSVVLGDGPHFWSAPFEVGAEFGGLGLPAHITPALRRLAWKGGGQPATTVAVVATDASLTKAQCKRLAIAANDGLARALRIAHAAMDGDTVFAAATGARPLEGAPGAFVELCATAADCLARAVARGVYEARVPNPAWKGPPAWADLYSGAPPP